MKIGIPISGCDMGESGISRYLVELLKALAAAPRGHEYLLIGSAAALDIFDPRAPAFTRFVIPDAVAAPPLPNLWWNATALGRLVRERGLDTLFFPAANRRMPFLPGVPVTGTLHDLSSLHVKGKYPFTHEVYIHRVVPFLLKRLDRVICVSEATRRDLLETVGADPERAAVVPHGVDLSRFDPAAARAAATPTAERLGLKSSYYLYLSRIEHPGKNHVRLIRAYNEYRNRGGLDRLLVLAGKDWDRAELVHREAEASPWRADIRFTGFVRDEDVAGLYGGARALFFPSLFEGFGMPILEAMASGVPVFCSNCSSLPEVGGDAARYFDPEDESAIAAALAAADDDVLLARMRAEGIARAAGAGWERAASDTLDIIESGASAPQRSRA